MRVTLEIKVNPEKWLIASDGPDPDDPDLSGDIAGYVAAETACAEHILGSAASVRLVAYE